MSAGKRQICNYHKSNTITQRNAMQLGNRENTTNAAELRKYICGMLDNRRNNNNNNNDDACINKIRPPQQQTTDSKPRNGSQRDDDAAQDADAQVLLPVAAIVAAVDLKLILILQLRLQLLLQSRRRVEGL
ncbi:unnamed protein product [Ceratitis capitata]|uniref:(Mediterranean fruit fly) hypothetical protein n=1 Tax=Ceratitis capitata TaxID=7213 RepID=A0A811UPL5_CERCA|nr:unnamed protein product [Ceratitis capitata]